MEHLRLAAAGLLLLALAACGEGDSTDVDSSSNGTGPVVAHPDAGHGSGTQALVGGPLTLSGGCLLLGGFPVVWPHGTTWDGDAQAVRLPDGQMASLGDRVSGGGGYPYLSDLGPELAESLADCPLNKHGEIAMFNAVEQITVTS